MARIAGFTAPRLNLNPSDRAQAAWETAGRRVGPLYNEVGQTYRETARAQAATAKGRMWPYDILALGPDAATQTANALQSKSSRGATGFSTRSGGGGGGRGGGNAHGQGEVGAGAAGMSRLAREMVGKGGGASGGGASDYGSDFGVKVMRGGAGQNQVYAPGFGPNQKGEWATDDNGNPLYLPPPGASQRNRDFADTINSSDHATDPIDFNNEGGPAGSTGGSGTWSDGGGFFSSIGSGISGAVSAIGSAIGGIWNDASAQAQSYDAPPAEVTADIPNE